MSKKTCCCKGQCEWCNHDHYVHQFSHAPIYQDLNITQDAQPNWKTLGTTTTELPSVGHPMAAINNYNCLDYTHKCIPEKPIPVGQVFPEDNPTGELIFINTLRSPEPADPQSKGWAGNGAMYGDICPAWFNGLNMSNILKDDDIFFNFTFELKIEKLNQDESTTTIIDIKQTGPGKNLRPHPDACHSYNVNDILWVELSKCGIFNTNTDEDGNIAPCARDFAKMPRGPWPYRFKPYLDIDRNDFDHCGNGEAFYTREEVKKYKDKDKSFFPYTTSYNKLIKENIKECNLVQQDCSFVQPHVNEASCCPESLPYIKRNQYCDRLDPDHGTPFGWEDCPIFCAGYSNSVINNGSVNPEMLNFFGWWNPVNRYTTPEWDFFDNTTQTSKRLSLHVIVPTQAKSFCDPIQGNHTEGFGEWSFGMDYQAEAEIDSLERSGYIWSDGREQDGVWINKTPTGALRVLFTLDHMDLDQGKVWRVFRDWDVSVTNLVKTFNAGTPDEVKFKITLKQKVEEVQFSSMGCDCPSGYTVNSDGTVTPIEPACDPHLSYADGAPHIETPDAPCWQSNIDGISPEYQGNNQEVGGRVSFCERGPIAIKMKVETDETGCQMCNETREHPQGYQNCTDKFGTVTRSGGSEESNSGQIFIVNTPGFDSDSPTDTRFNIYYANPAGYWPTELKTGASYYSTGFQGNACKPQVVFDINENKPVFPPPFVVNWFKENGSRYNEATADIPYPISDVKKGVASNRYRNVYSAVKMSQSAIDNDKDYNYHEYNHLYGSMVCRYETQDNCNRDPANPGYVIYNTASLFMDKWPTQAPVGYCWINCPCGAKGTNSSGSGVAVLDGDVEKPIDCYGWDEVKWGPCPYYGGGSGGNGANTSKCPCEEQNRGAKEYPSYGCKQNIASPYSPADSLFIKCSSQPEHGYFDTFCGTEFRYNWFGIDSERMYFTALAQVTTLSCLGDPNCAKACLCGGSQNSGCRWTDSTGTERCNFCLGIADFIAGGFRANTFINWKKYLCRKRSQEDYKIPVDIFANFSWSCDKIGTVIDGNYNSAEPCDNAWSLQDCQTINIPTLSYSESIKLIESKSNLKPAYRVNIKKYNIPKNDDCWCSWDTTYQPNPGYTRKHIVINAKGPL